jgi:hypothetical protein
LEVSDRLALVWHESGDVHEPSDLVLGAARDPAKWKRGREDRGLVALKEVDHAASARSVSESAVDEDDRRF